MKLIVFGATGMIGKGALLEALDDADVESVLSVVRRPSGMTHPKLVEIVHADFHNFDAVAPQLAGLDGCLFCLGVSSAGMNEAEYTKITYEITMAAARALKAASPNITFCFVSGASTDSSEKGSAMWARVKGKTENALIAMFGERSYNFRPGYIHPMRGVTSSTRLYRMLIPLFRPLYPIAKTFAPNFVTTSVTLGRALINGVKRGYSKRVLEVPDINTLGAPA